MSTGLVQLYLHTLTSPFPWIIMVWDGHGRHISEPVKKILLSCLIKCPQKTLLIYLFGFGVHHKQTTCWAGAGTELLYRFTISCSSRFCGSSSGGAWQLRITWFYGNRERPALLSQQTPLFVHCRVASGHNYYKILFSHINYPLAACKCRAPTRKNSTIFCLFAL